MDELYIKKVLDGDIDAFRYFVHQYKDRAYNIAFSVLKNEFDACDTVQEAFIIAFRKLGKFRGRSKFATWFYRIVINEALKSSKKTGKEKFFTDTRTNSVDPGHIEIKDNLSRDQQKYYIGLALQNIPSNEALTLTLFYIEEQTIEEIRQLTGWTESKIKVLLHRARKSMYHELNILLSTEKKTLY
ncbi:MAG: sigma-70 family RNA polymerase sigma factor [Deltaproteobacteria bacterium]|nr:sigma-70 family RNA polymerase sigma factor [Deltaproteobacteria bacterium]HDZ40103.1 sigma-70 family RNA polymerase sigma factor [Bacteroidota bacterium]